MSPYSAILLSFFFSAFVALINITYIVTTFVVHTSSGPTPLLGWNLERYMNADPVLLGSFITAVIGAGLATIVLYSFFIRACEQRCGNDEDRQNPRQWWKLFSYTLYYGGKVAAIVALLLLWVNMLIAHQTTSNMMHMAIYVTTHTDSFCLTPIQILNAAISGLCALGIILDAYFFGRELRRLFGGKGVDVGKNGKPGKEFMPLVASA